ncbi:MAG: DUF4397 domain-containing protein [Gemmatimonadales bacterium]
MSNHSETSSVRFIHNVAGAPNVDIYVDGKAVALQLAFSETTSYLQVKSGHREVTVFVASSKDTGAKPLLKQRVNLCSQSNNTAIVAGSVNELPQSLSLLLYKDDLKCPKGGYAHVRLIHAAFGAPAVDLYVNDVLTFSNVKYKHTGQPVYAPVKVGRVDNEGFAQPTTFTVKAAGSSVVVNYEVLFPDNRGIYTVVASDWKPAVPSVDTIINNDNKDECVVLKKNFDVQAYMGKWYQIASIPQFFDRDCARSTAQYTFLSNKVNVYNTCYNKEGAPIRSITGSAVAPNPCVPASLIVSFPNTPVPANPNYLVHSTDYKSYAIVGSPTLTTFFILSRQPTLCLKEYKEMLNYAKGLGYDVSLVKPGYQTLTKHCEESSSEESS